MILVQLHVRIARVRTNAPPVSTATTSTTSKPAPNASNPAQLAPQPLYAAHALMGTTSTLRTIHVQHVLLSVQPALLMFNVSPASTTTS